MINKSYPIPQPRPTDLRPSYFGQLAWLALMLPLAAGLYVFTRVVAAWNGHKESHV